MKNLFKHVVACIFLLAVGIVTSATSTEAIAEEISVISVGENVQLSKENGIVEGPSGLETYYTIRGKSEAIPFLTKRVGLTRKDVHIVDGVYILDVPTEMTIPEGSYVIAASNREQVGSLVDTTLGKGIVLDLMEGNGYTKPRIDICTAW